MEFNLGGRARYRLVLLKSNTNKEYEKVKTFNIKPQEKAIRYKVGGLLSTKEIREYEIDTSKTAWQTEKNTHFLYMDYDTGETLTFFNKIQPSNNPVDTDALNLTGLVKAAMRQITGDYGLIVVLLALGMGLAVGALVGANINGITQALTGGSPSPAP